MCESSKGLRDRVHILVHWLSPPQKIDNIIHHNLLKLSKYGYTYKLKYDSKTLEKVPMYGRANKKNQIRQKDKSFSNLKRWESTLVSVLWSS
jgi:hypothetical protein